jgi:Na+-transporting methylmalonyl-CoA/oxaloacetate decarboxylase beta subunit
MYTSGDIPLIQPTVKRTFTHNNDRRNVTKKHVQVGIADRLPPWCVVLL